MHTGSSCEADGKTYNADVYFEHNLKRNGLSGACKPTANHTFACDYFSVGRFVETTPQLLAGHLIFVVGLRLRESTTLFCANGHMKMRVLTEEAMNIQRMQYLVMKVNEAFGGVTLINCLRDIVSFIALSGAWLKILDQQPDESNEAFAARENDYQAFCVYVYAVSFAGLVNAMYRMGLSIYCQKQVNMFCVNV